MTNLIDLYPHNKVVFNKVLENLKTHNKVGVVQATGTGKGKLAACLVEFLVYHKSNAKILIVAPLRSILQNYQDNFELSFPNIEYITYQKIYKIENIEWVSKIKSYDLIILDEFHRCGASEWGKKIRLIFDNLDNSSYKVIGLTATPVRFLDNSRDMGVELFDGNIIQGVNLEDAILDGILPGFIYNACYFKAEEKLKEIKNNLENNEYKLLDDSVKDRLLTKISNLSLSYNNRLKIETIIQNGTRDLGKNQKWVIFCKDKNNLEEVKIYCKEWFNSKPNLYFLYSENSDLENDSILSSFRKSKVGINVLLCINMLNEGVHIKDLNGVIMLRKTDSPIIFLQQLGRALEVGKDFKPIIFDLIGNYSGLKQDRNAEIDCENPIAIVKRIAKKTKNKNSSVIVNNFTVEFDEFLNELNSFIAKYSYWTKEEDNILVKYYNIGGAVLCQEKGINKDTNAISHRASYLGLRYVNKDSYWKPEEVDILRKYYKKGGYKLCQEMGLSYKTPKQISSKAGKLGLSDKSENLPYTSEEDAIIIKYYPLGFFKLCQEKGLKRTKSSIIARARLLGITVRETQLWTDKEEAVIKKYYPLGGYKLCQENGLSYRDKDAICQKANKLGVGKLSHQEWSIEEYKILDKYFPIGGVKACHLNGLSHRSEQSIYRRARERGLKNIKGKLK